MKPIIYISGPYSKGNVNDNVRKAIRAGEDIEAMGLLPFIPHLYHLWDMMYPHDWQYWMDLDMAWIPKCQALLRLPGESAGADLEVAEARKLGIPVFYDPTSLEDYFNARGESVA